MPRPKGPDKKLVNFRLTLPAITRITWWARQNKQKVPTRLSALFEDPDIFEKLIELENQKER